MLTKLETTFEALMQEGKIKTRWTELEERGITELVHLMSDHYQNDYNIATTTIVEKGKVFLHMYEGIMYEHEGSIYTLAKAYIDADSNIVFTTPSVELFLYEIDIIDAEDPKHTFGND